MGEYIDLKEKFFILNVLFICYPQKNICLNMTADVAGSLENPDLSAKIFFYFSKKTHFDKFYIY